MVPRRGKKYIQERTNDTTKQEVTVGKLPVVKCSICKKKMAYKPGKTSASDVLTAHYKKVHGIG